MKHDDAETTDRHRYTREDIVRGLRERERNEARNTVAFVGVLAIVLAAAIAIAVFA